MLAWFGNLRLRWKILLAPIFLILVLVVLGAHTVSTLKSSHETVDALIGGPVRQAEAVSEFNTAIWAAQARLYNLTATAANESDQKKIKAVADKAAAALDQVPGKLKAFDSLKTDERTGKVIERLQAAVAGYIKPAKTVVEMWDDAGSALMFVVSAERNFSQIEQLTNEMTALSTQMRDQEVAGLNAWLERQVTLLPFAVVFAVGIGCLVSILVSGGIVRPVRQITAAIKCIADGNYDVVVPATGRRDEVGVVANAVQMFKENLIRIGIMEAERKQADELAAVQRRDDMHRLADEFQATVGSIIEKVSSASTELEASAGSLTRTAQNTEELSGTVAAASEQASANVQSVASATDEISSSVHEIARQVHESSSIACSAVKQAEKTNARIAELAQAASRIGDVVKLITSVAEQTNLLALNATIEAARAGEAGRGFAVVAQEVKALAAQTAKATGEIGTQIAGMQAATHDSVTAIKEISATINRISEIATAVAAAVEEQGAATQEIARNVQQAAHGTAQVASNITDVSRGAGETGSASTQVLASAQSLSGESQHLKAEVEKFLATVRAA